MPVSFWEETIDEYLDLKNKSSNTISYHSWRALAFIYYCIDKKYEFNNALCNMIDADGEITDEEIKQLKNKWYLSEQIIGCLSNAIDCDYKLKDKYINELIN